MAKNQPYACEYCGETFATGGEKGGHIRGYHSNPITDEDLLGEIRRLAKEKGRAPSANEMDAEGAYSAGTVASRFGSWTAALQQVGLEPVQHGHVGDTELIQDIRRVGAMLGQTPTADQMTQFGKFSHRTAQNRFGGWNTALGAAGFDPPHLHRIGEEELLEEIHRLAEELGRPPYLTDLNESGDYSQRPYYRAFGSWSAALEAAGYRPRGRGGQMGPENTRWKGGRIKGFGPAWLERREQVIARDAYRCQMPGCEITRSEHIKLFGFDLNVHHIIPRRSFQIDEGFDYQAANAMDNLVTLCQRHHAYWEQMSPLRPDTRHLTGPEVSQ